MWVPPSFQSGCLRFKRGSFDVGGERSARRAEGEAAELGAGSEDFLFKGIAKMPMSGVTAKEPAQMVTNSVHCWIARQKTLAPGETSSSKKKGRGPEIQRNMCSKDSTQSFFFSRAHSYILVYRYKNW